MLHINIISIGKTKELYIKQAIDEYSKRLSRFCDLQIVELIDTPIPEKINDSIISSIKDSDSNKLLKHLPNGYNICLDLTRCAIYL